MLVCYLVYTVGRAFDPGSDTDDVRDPDGHGGVA
jgi:hypothetical protein